ncbi:hypothetical protein CF641_37620, partial [Burkholderia pseudomallei]
ARLIAMVRSLLDRFCCDDRARRRPGKIRTCGESGR